MFDQVYFFLVWFCDQVCLLIFDELGMQTFFSCHQQTGKETAYEF